MVNVNGTFVEKETFQLSRHNRGFAYGDSLFESIGIKNGKPRFVEDHYFRLMASMRMIRMEIPMYLTLDYFEAQIVDLITAVNSEKIFKAKFTVYRKEGGLYTPDTNAIDFFVEVFEGEVQTKETFEIDLFKDHYVISGLLSTLKSSNRLINVVSGIYAKENELDGCVLINEQKNIVELTNANIFLIKGTHIRTPKLLDGCIKGIARKKIIEFLEKSTDFTIEETTISPFDLQKADEVFVSNAVTGIQCVTKYRKKNFETSIGNSLAKIYASL